ncbi:DNA-3-methyladenine glycosylase I [Agromyces atrinae]|uniref:DNA-3-methyladenine glycosylase I n=1 Tax=Agromyces atrinae TaxID=592376 RepID=A0A4Q2M109_9MICO|nr:DNA-3-methyladenine glycosylase I [Agromyces atrinae]NYD65752.1 DNA-3-methyladenine glycosylase I [Agromyces atrinae]RXZ85544.1 DNA-3-methyladenine glycosylase I [Agromyces atrinae]
MSDAAGTTIVTATPPARASLIVGDDGRARCAWSGNDDEYRRYHDDEWGRALRDDRRLFEKISLEGFQAGLSWITILRRREAFRSAFDGFDVARVAAFTTADVDRLVLDASIIRHRGKIEAVISNARATLALDRPLSEVLWQFAPPPGPRPKTLGDVPATTEESAAMSKTLRKLGFRFVGPTTMYALMQSTGMVDDHVVGCFRAENADGTASPS